MCSASNLQKYRKNFNAIKAGASVCQVISSAWSNLKIPHRHFTLTIPKILRRYFLYDRSLLSDPSRCAWESLKVFFQEAVPERNPIPGVIIAVQTFGDFLGFSPHAHVIVTDGCFYGDKDMFQVAPPLELEKLARYIIRASFSQERMQYLDQEAKVVYTSKDGKSTKVFDALEWLAAICV